MTLILMCLVLTRCASDPGPGDETPTTDLGGGPDLVDAGSDAARSEVVDDGVDETGGLDATPTDITAEPGTTDANSDGSLTDTTAFDGCVPLPSREEICGNQFDDNCDGLVDERCSCAPERATQWCYPGNPLDLEGQATACQAGTQVCSLEFWGTCEGAIGPSAEVCEDAVDNDCDGEVDEDCAVDPPTATCPADFSGPVLRLYNLTGAYDDPNGTPLATAFWSELSAPPGHSRDVRASGLEVEFFADVAGTYVFELTVQNAAGLSATCETRFVALTEDVLRIEMFWNPDYTESGGNPPDRSDLDLLLHRDPLAGHAYYNDSETCYWSNCATCDRPYDDDAGRETECRAFLANEPPADYPANEPWPEPALSWAPGELETDPRLDLDDVEGKGPENINVRRPNPGVYRVAVHYFDDEGFGPSLAFVRVLCAGVELHASEGVRLETHGLSTNVFVNELWEVGDVTVSYDDDGVPNCEFQRFGRTDCHRICTLAEANQGGCPPASCE